MQVKGREPGRHHRMWACSSSLVLAFVGLAMTLISGFAIHSVLATGRSGFLGRHIGRYVASMLGAALLATVVNLVFGRSLRTWNRLLSIFLALVILGSGIQSVQVYSRQRERMGVGVSRAERTAWDDCLASIRKANRRNTDEFDSARIRFHEMGGVEPETFQSCEDIDARIACVQTMLDAARRMEEDMREYPARMRDCLEQSGAMTATFEETLAEMEADRMWRVEQLDRELNVMTGERLLAACNCLRSRWGAWQMEDGSGAIVFDGEEGAAEFQRILAELEAIESKHVSVRVQLEQADRQRTRDRRP